MSGLRTQCVGKGNMKVVFRTFADFREVIGAREQELSLPEGETVGGLLKGLRKGHPRPQEKPFDASGDVKTSIIILKNGRNIEFRQHPDTIIATDDAISVFPPVARG